MCSFFFFIFPLLRYSNNDFYSHVPCRNLFKLPRAFEISSLCLFPLIRAVNLGINESVDHVTHSVSVFRRPYGREVCASMKREEETSHLCLVSVWSPCSRVCSPQQEFLPFSSGSAFPGRRPSKENWRKS